MRLIYITLIPGLLLCAVTLQGQDSWYGSVSDMHIMYNPAWAGVGGAPALDISATSFFPGKGLNIKSVYASYDGYFTGIHGGAGVWMTDDLLGEILNDLRAGASYAYHFRAGHNVYITAGLTASFINRGIKAGSIILPEDIDPFRGITGGSSVYTSQASLSRFDLGTGISVSGGRWYGGVSVMHLTQPSLSSDDQQYNTLRRLYTINGGASFNSSGNDLVINPSAVFLFQGDSFTLSSGVELLFRGLITGISVWHIYQGFTSAVTSLGWSDDRIRITLSHDYILAGGDGTLNGTAIIRAGFSFSFDNVEKRKTIHIIKLPVL